MTDTGLVQPTFRGNADALNILARRNLCFAQRLHARNLKLLKRPLAFKSTASSVCSRSTSAFSTAP